jgi:TetR/AcrR family transcriptional regulator, tetracycline repressor protein
VQDSRLTPDSIVEEALHLLNEEGLEGVSLRKLAGRLGISAPSLYWHFPDKSALLAALIERIFDAGLHSVPAHRDWQSWMRDFGAAMWKMQRATRDFSGLVATTPISGDMVERALGKMRAALAHVDLEQAEAMRIQSSIQALVLGWSALAHAPYAGKLAETLDFDVMVRDTLELLIAGESLKLTSSGASAGAPTRNI